MIFVAVDSHLLIVFDISNLTQCPIHHSGYLQFNVALLFRYSKSGFKSQLILHTKCSVLWNCSWSGFKNSFKEHVTEAHSDHCFNEPTFISPILNGASAFVSYFGGLFAYCKLINDGRFYCAVQLIGTSSEASKYKCEFTLRAANGVEQISNTFLVHGYSDDWETIFNSEICLKLDEDTVKHFVQDNNLKLTVTLSRV